MTKSVAFTGSYLAEGVEFGGPRFSEGLVPSIREGVRITVEG